MCIFQRCDRVPVIGYKTLYSIRRFTLPMKNLLRTPKCINKGGYSQQDCMLPVSNHNSTFKINLKLLQLPNQHTPSK